MRALLLLVLVGAAACSSGPGATLDARGLDRLAVDRAPGERQIPPIQLPRDEAPHSDMIEWWYYTGTLQTAAERYGFEAVTFQVIFSSKPVYIGQLAITDLQKKSYTLALQTSYTDQRGGTSGFDLDVGGWKMSGHGGKDQLSAAMPGYALEATLTSRKPVAIHYGKGWMTIGTANPFYYYSYTRMDVSGALTVDGIKQAVTGEAWMDHQWGEIGIWGADFTGWDWYSLRLDDQSEVMIFVVRRAGGGFSGGTIVDAKGATRPLQGGDFVIASTGQWKSPHTAATYPQGWTVRIPSAGLDVTVTAELPDQEYYKSFAGTPRYWEGLCAVKGTQGGKAVAGTGYVELTGYEP